MSEIVVQNLTKRFKDHTVLNHISMKLESGHIYGLVGRNGSGKTMLLKHMLGFLYPDEGYVSIDGKQIGKDVDIPDRVGAIIENPGFLADYSGFQNLRLLAMIRHEISDQDIKDAIRLVGLDPESKKHVGKYSLGMRQRLGIAQALMENPDILLLDEPLSGLDNRGVEDMYRVFLQQRDEGKLIVLASHSREDIKVLCDRIFYMDQGNIISDSAKDPSPEFPQTGQEQIR
ncbi:MAG: ABC transporter ATP-binding protein [Lachnospiraceae bacterium]